MRSYEEINADVLDAVEHSDIAAIGSLQQELRALGTPQALARENWLTGRDALMHGHFAEAVQHYEAALAIYEELGDRASQALTIGTIGIVHFNKTELPQALDHFQRALAIYQDIGDTARVGHMTGNMGNVYYQMGDHALAMEHYRNALHVLKQRGDRKGEAWVMGNLGILLTDTDDYGAALQHYHDALALHEELGSKVGMANAIHSIGTVYGSLSDYPRALEYFLRSLAICEEMGDVDGIARVLGNIGKVHQDMGDAAQAMEFFDRAQALYENMGHHAGVANILVSVGRLKQQEMDHEGALELYRRALQLHENAGKRLSIASSLGHVIDMLMQLKKLDEARELLDRQSTMDLDAYGLRSQHAANRATLAEHHGDLESAHSSLLEALDIATKAGRRSEMVDHHLRLRDLAQKRNDFAGYVEHNTASQQIAEEIRGRVATQKLATMESERKMEGERREREKEKALLYGALPESVANRMLRGDDVSGDHYPSAAVLFLDIVGFTSMSDSLPADQVVQLLEEIFSALDDVVERYGVTKIKTIGDSYMAVAFPVDHELISEDQEPRTDHLVRAAKAALDMLAALHHLDADAGNQRPLRVRIGLHCGPVTAGVIGTKRLQYDVWGDTVNVASRMESTSEPGRIQVSGAFAKALESRTGDLSLFTRGKIMVKGKGELETFWLEGAHES
jgi:adenylate cyclase